MRVGRQDFPFRDELQACGTAIHRARDMGTVYILHGALMNRSLFRCIGGLLCGACLISLSSSATVAQFGGAGNGNGQLAAGGISASETGVIRRPADRMRVVVAVTARGKDLDEALLRLKVKRVSLTTQLAGLGALKESVVMSPAFRRPGNLDQQWQIDVMQQRKRNEGQKTPEKTIPQPTVLTLHLKADWPLPVQGQGQDDALLSSVLKLQDKIKAADLGGLKALKGRFPKDEDAEETLDEDPLNFQQDESQVPGRPVFYFVANITDDDRKQAIAEAFQKIKVSAAQLADVAGVRLGNMQRLSVSRQSGTAGMPSGEFNFTLSLRQFIEELEHGPRIEAVGAELGLLSYHVTVVASFESMLVK